MSEEREKRGLVPKLRFPEFRGSAGWSTSKVGALVETITPPKKLQSDQYQRAGAVPIIDQSQTDIAGWTDDRSAAVSVKSTLIVFGDHTCALKRQTKPFAQGADGIKILEAKPPVDADFLFQSLLHKPLQMEEYKRHFSILCDRVVAYPVSAFAKETEQRKIADCLQSLDDLIAAQTEKLEALKRHKKGLLQQLFPAEGETTPRLRFPGFRRNGEWRQVSLGDVCTLISGQHLGPDQYAKSGLLPYFSGPSDLTNEISRVEKWVNQSNNTGKSNDILVTVKGSGAGGVWMSLLSEFAIGRQLMAVRATGCDPHFVFQYLLTQNARLSAMATGNLIPGLSRPDLLTLVFGLPRGDEQKATADLLGYLDALMIANELGIEQLRTHKAALMQQLFPSLDEAEG